jgi:hypothetical protein
VRRSLALTRNNAAQESVSVTPATRRVTSWSLMVRGRAGDQATSCRRPTADVECTKPLANTAGMPRKPEPPKPTSWNIYKVDQKAILLGTFEAPKTNAALSRRPPRSSKPTPGGYTRCRCDDAERGGGAALLPPRQQRTISEFISP